MNNQSMSSSSSSSPHKHDQKLKSALVAVEEKETINNPKQRSPQEIVSERTNLEMPSCRLSFFRKKRDTVPIHPPKDNKISHTCRFCKRNFKSCFALGGHMKCHKKERELEKQRKIIEDAMLCVSTPFTLQRLPVGPCKYGQGGSSHALSTDGINLDLTLGPSKSTGGSNNSTNNNTNSSFHGNLMTPVGPCVPRYSLVAGNQVDSSNIHIPPNQTTDLCYDFFALQEGSKGENKVMVPEDDKVVDQGKRSRGE